MTDKAENSENELGQSVHLSDGLGMIGSFSTEQAEFNEIRFSNGDPIEVFWPEYEQMLDVPSRAFVQSVA